MKRDKITAGEGKGVVVVKGNRVKGEDMNIFRIDVGEM